MGAWSPANEIAVPLAPRTHRLRRGEGIVLNEPSVVAIEKATGKVKGIGSKRNACSAARPTAFSPFAR